MGLRKGDTVGVQPLSGGQKIVISYAPTLSLSELGPSAGSEGAAKSGRSICEVKGDQYPVMGTLDGMEDDEQVLFIPERRSRFGTEGGRNGDRSGGRGLWNEQELGEKRPLRMEWIEIQCP